MSLIKQLWVSVVLLMVLAFGASFIISLISSKNYLVKELQNKNIDNANSLALSMSQMEKDMVNLELLLSAQFDSGHYQLILLSDPTGKVLVERKSDNKTADVPDWFEKLVPINVLPGYAQVNDGWNQFGTIKLETNTKFAYRDLWEGGRALLIASLVVSLISGYIGSLVLRRILSPLNSVVDQAEALGERRFITTNEPKTTEFKALVKAMNTLSYRIKTMLEEESSRLEKLRVDANYDSATRLMNREYFFNRMGGYIANEESFSGGVLVISRIANLTEIDQTIGKEETDGMLKRVGEALDAFSKEGAGTIVGRLSGRDIGVFIGENINAFNFASKINGLILNAGSLKAPAPQLQLTTVCSQLKRDDTAEDLYGKVSNIINELVSNNASALHVISEDEIAKRQDKNEDEWRTLLTNALKAKRIKLAQYPVINKKKKIIHQECPVRLQLQPDGPWVSAGEFISWASRLNLVNQIDLMVVECALDTIANKGEDIGLNISSNAMTNANFMQSMQAMIADQPAVAKHLWLEVPERGVFEHLEAFRAFCNVLKPLGCKIGIEHVGAYVSRLGELHDLGIDYIKVDVSIISGIDKNTGNQAFVRGLCLIAHSIGLIAIAEGVQTAEELACLPDLGLDGMTGPGVKPKKS